MLMVSFPTSIRLILAWIPPCCFLWNVPSLKFASVIELLYSDLKVLLAYMTHFDTTLVFYFAGSTVCQNLMKRSEAVASGFVIIMHDAASRSSLLSSLNRQGYLRHIWVLVLLELLTCSFHCQL